MGKNWSCLSCTKVLSSIPQTPENAPVASQQSTSPEILMKSEKYSTDASPVVALISQTAAAVESPNGEIISSPNTSSGKTTLEAPAPLTVMTPSVLSNDHAIRFGTNEPQIIIHNSVKMALLASCQTKVDTVSSCTSVSGIVVVTSPVLSNDHVIRFGTSEPQIIVHNSVKTALLISCQTKVDTVSSTSVSGAADTAQDSMGPNTNKNSLKHQHNSLEVETDVGMMSVTEPLSIHTNVVAHKRSIEDIIRFGGNFVTPSQTSNTTSNGADYPSIAIISPTGATKHDDTSDILAMNSNLLTDASPLIAMVSETDDFPMPDRHNGGVTNTSKTSLDDTMPLDPSSVVTSSVASNDHIIRFGATEPQTIVHISSITLQLGTQVDIHSSSTRLSYIGDAVQVNKEPNTDENSRKSSLEVETDVGMSVTEPLSIHTNVVAHKRSIEDIIRFGSCAVTSPASVMSSEHFDEPVQFNCPQPSLSSSPTVSLMSVESIIRFGGCDSNPICYL